MRDSGHITGKGCPWHGAARLIEAPVACWWPGLGLQAAEARIKRFVMPDVTGRAKREMASMVGERSVLCSYEDAVCTRAFCELLQ